MKNLFNKYKFPLRLSNEYEDNNHIVDADGVEVLGTSEWLRIDDEDAQDIVDILNEYNKLLEQIGKMQLEMYTKNKVEQLLRKFDDAINYETDGGGYNYYNVRIPDIDEFIKDNL